jgi:hypothetical protein
LRCRRANVFAVVIIDPLIRVSRCATSSFYCFARGARGGIVYQSSQVKDAKFISQEFDSSSRSEREREEQQSRRIKRDLSIELMGIHQLDSRSLVRRIPLVSQAMLRLHIYIHISLSNNRVMSPNARQRSVCDIFVSHSTSAANCKTSPPPESPESVPSIYL